MNSDTADLLLALGDDMAAQLEKGAPKEVFAGFFGPKHKVSDTVLARALEAHRRVSTRTRTKKAGKVLRLDAILIALELVPRKAYFGKADLGIALAEWFEEEDIEYSTHGRRSDKRACAAATVAVVATINALAAAFELFFDCVMNDDGGDSDPDEFSMPFLPEDDEDEPFPEGGGGGGGGSGSWPGEENCQQEKAAYEAAGRAYEAAFATQQIVCG
ncbi:MAG: hypothetical protein AAF871_13230 [Pseudomonadota bacterium]